MNDENYTPWDSAEFLGDEEAVIEYLQAALEENDPAFVVKAIGNVARAKGMSRVAQDTRLGRQNLYKALSGERNPRFGTLMKVLDSLGMQLTVAPRQRVDVTDREGMSSALAEHRSVDKFIAFFDVLGWKSLVRVTEEENDLSVQKVLDVLDVISSELRRFRDFFEDAGPEICPAAPRHREDMDFRFSVFSDSVVLSSEVSPAGLINLLNCCHSVYFRLFSRMGLMCRGYVKRGLIYHTSDHCVGSGLGDVVEGEQKVSIFRTESGERGTPFIEVDRNVLQYVEDETSDSCVREMFSECVRKDGDTAAIFPFTRLDPGIFGDGSEGPNEKIQTVDTVRSWIDRSKKMISRHVDPSSESARRKEGCLIRMLDSQLALCDRMERQIGEESELFPAHCFTPEHFPGPFPRSRPDV